MKPVRIEHLSLHQSTSAHLRKLIAAGIYRTHLPGERTLARELGVSRNTCRAALFELTEDGVLEPVEPGKQRKIKCSLATHHEKVLLHLSSPLREPDSLELRLAREKKAAWEGLHGPMRHRHVNLQRIRSAGKSLARLIDQTDAEALYLSSPAAAWTEAAVASGLPTYCSGGQFNTVSSHSFTATAYSLRKEIKRATLLLQQSGHQKIIVPIRRESSYLIAPTIEALLEEVPAEISTHKFADWFPVFETGDRAACEVMWTNSFRNLQPTAILAHSSEILISLYFFCIRMGIKIPEDVSIISLDHDPLLEWLEPQPRTMIYPEKKAVRFFKKWISSGLKPHGCSILDLEIGLEGATVMPTSHQRIAS